MNLTKRSVCPLAFALISIAFVSLAGAQVSVTRVADIEPGSAGSRPNNLIYFNGQLYFDATTTATGSELWRYGPDGAHLAADIAPGANGSSPFGFVSYQNQLYFTGNNFGVWHYDGVSVSQVSGVTGDVEDLGVYNGNLYFINHAPGSGPELYRYNGATVSLALDINPDPETSSIPSGGSYPTNFAVYNGNLYFHALGSNGSPIEPFRYDGTTATRLSAISGGPTVMTSLGATNKFTVFDGKLYFAGTDGTHGTELWQFDGAHTQLVADISAGSTGSNPSYMTVLGHTLYFAANDGVHGTELWKFDGTTTSLVDINIGAGGSSPSSIAAYGDAIYFSAIDKATPAGNGRDRPDPSGTGFELWKFDGNMASQVADINPGFGSSSPFGLFATPDGLYFSANDGVTGAELYRLVNVPEPASVVLLSFACAAGFLWRGRR